MAIPTKEEFELAEDLIRKAPEHLFHMNYENIIPDKQELVRLIREMGDLHEEYLKRIRSLKVYKWLTSHSLWTDVTKNIRLIPLSEDFKHDHTESWAEWCLSFYKPITKVEYYLYKKGLSEFKAREEKKYLNRGYEQNIVADRLSTSFPIKTFEELNSEKSRLHHFQWKARKLFYIQPPYELEIISAFYHFFYDSNYMAELTASNDNSYYFQIKNDYKKALDGLNHLVPVVEQFYDCSVMDSSSEKLDENQQLEEGKQVNKKYIDLLLHLDELKKKISEEYQYACYKVENPVDDYDLLFKPIKRQDDTARIRMLASKLFEILNPYSKLKGRRPVRAIETLLQFEGIHNTVDRRNIEDWLKGYDELGKERQRYLDESILFF